MYKDLISYELADGVSKEKLLTIANKILESWMSKQEGFVKWEIHQDVDTDGYADIVYWENVEAAKKAEKDMGNIPNAHEWYGCFKEGSISAKHLNKIM